MQSHVDRQKIPPKNLVKCNSQSKTVERAKLPKPVLLTLIRRLSTSTCPKVEGEEREPVGGNRRLWSISKCSCCIACKAMACQKKKPAQSSLCTSRDTRQTSDSKTDIRQYDRSDNKTDIRQKDRHQTARQTSDSKTDIKADIRTDIKTDIRSRQTPPRGACGGCVNQ